MPHTKRFSSTSGFLIAACIVFLPGCATKIETIPPRAEITPAPSSTVPLPATPQPTPANTPTQATNLPARNVTPKPSPTPRSIPHTVRKDAAPGTEKPWTSEVRSAAVVEKTKTSATFQKPVRPGRTTSLFEDSILLSKVRGRLLANQAIAKSLESVRVNRGVASLRMHAGTDASVLTAAANAALGVEGIHSASLEWK